MPCAFSLAAHPIHKNSQPTNLFFSSPNSTFISQIQPLMKSPSEDIRVLPDLQNPYHSYQSPVFFFYYDNFFI
ncbi:hypothetical protein PRUPE_2G104900 [Prunus persica]|uniref:Uncharacterized protein n=1 Tax=Prunus persica TaxID=3760 RepID=A0A251QE29_PRUPE|nr:hypothetical protein PRUPE_2G104900 [Prunus persica]